MNENSVDVLGVHIGSHSNGFTLVHTQMGSHSPLEAVWEKDSQAWSRRQALHTKAACMIEENTEAATQNGSV